MKMIKMVKIVKGNIKRPTQSNSPINAEFFSNFTPTSIPNVDVVFEWFGRVVPKVGLNPTKPIHEDRWIKRIHCRNDWDLLSCREILQV
jgi:hypothetical protein